MNEIEFKIAWQQLMLYAKKLPETSSVTKISRKQYPIPNSGIKLFDPIDNQFKWFLLGDSTTHLGHGDFAAVKRAYDADYNTYAIKIQPADYDKNNQELAILKRLCRLKGHGKYTNNTYQNKSYLLQELILGKSLNSYSKNALNLANLSLPEQQYIFIALCKQVLKMQLLGIAHNDLHWGNIMYHRPSGLVTIIDYGSSHLHPACQLNGKALHFYAEDTQVLGEILQLRFNYIELYAHGFLPTNIHLTLRNASKKSSNTLLERLISTMDCCVKPETSYNN